MKVARPAQQDSGGPSSTRRAQPVRQTRTNPPRANTVPSRNLGVRDTIGGGPGNDQPIDIFPAITHFTDAITSLPKDLVRHFTLLKEVDAKIFAPEETLFQLVDAAHKSNPPEPRNANDASSTFATVPTPMSAQNSSSSLAQGGNHPPGSTDESYNHNPAVFDPSNIPRRQLFRQTAYKIQEMLVSLEEKNHVLSTANDSLSKQLGRVNQVWPHLETEFSDEAKWGSTTHWAYPENNRAQKASAADRSRRDGAAHLAAAAQQLVAEEAAARSDARKQAIAARKGLKNQHQEADADENENKPKTEPSKKATGSKSRKAAEAPAPVGLGITAATNANGNPPSKRRKVENNKATNGSQPMERAMSSVFGSSAPKSKNSSPRATPAPEQPKKRKALPTASNGLAKKNKTALATAAASPSTVASPVLPNFADAKVAGRASPAPPTNASRPASSRARQNSIHSNVENSRQRPASSASNKPNGLAAVATAAIPLDLAVIANGSQPTTEPKAPKEQSAIKSEHKEEANHMATTSTGNGNKKESSAKGIIDTESKGDTATIQPQTNTTVVTTKSGRASKPSTPALGSFPDPAPSRSRSSRNHTTTGAKRSHKKGAAQQALAARLADEDANGSAQGDDEGDADEPLYCYCNGVSYGEMVACDANDCEREWFHLECVGLKAAPPSNVKWYCDHCKDRLKTGKKVNGR
ncbi:hypothetical protein F5Y15DRAFT_375404 [Xylariaceae sp. FL0016]|nr:hypothetical protein F5Y15DRAFT_375404 [Xylariaceae sp. FL0016]